MSLDQFVACRRAPKLPDDLPQAAKWTRSEFEGTPFYQFDGGRWLLSVNVEPVFLPEMQEQLAEDLADTGIAGAKVSDYPVLVSVGLEPVTTATDAIDLQMDVLDMLIETCDGVVMAN